MSIWAKSDGTSLSGHTLDVLTNVKNLWEEVKNKINTQPLSKDEFSRMLYLAAFSHDFGKVWPPFQWALGHDDYMKDYRKKLKDLSHIQHNLLSLFFLNKEKALRFIAKDENEWRLIAPLLYSAIAFHHWRSDSSNILLGLKGVLRDVAKRLKDGLGEKLGNLLKQEFENFSEDGLNSDFIKFDESFALYISDYGDFLSSSLFFPPYSVTLLPQRMIKRDDAKDITWVFLAGFLMRADHFASWKEKKEVDEEIERKYIPVKFLDQIEKKNWWQAEKVKDHIDDNVVLVAPTGIGKTEFAFAWGEGKKGDKFIFTLPLRVATNQIFKRAVDIFEKGKEGVVGILHSDADVFLKEQSENYEGEVFLTLDLAKHLSLPVIIATGDQFFPSALRYPGYEKIYATLGYSRLIIDEVQAYDPRAAAIVVKLIKDIVALGGKFLLMTATLPEFVKRALNMDEGKDYEKIDLFSGYKKVKFEFPLKHKVEVRVGSIRDERDESIVKEIVEKARKGKRILVVLNTVEEAQNVYHEISNSNKEGDGKSDVKKDLILLHSRFTYEDRKKKEKDVEKKLAKRGEDELKNSEENQKGIIVIATQIVEASLDIDADYLYTEIAPADSLVQRMGRVLRGVRSEEWNDYDNLYKRNEANIKIFINPDKDKKCYESGKGKVYKNYLIEATIFVLNKNFDSKEENGIWDGMDRNKLKKEVEKILQENKPIFQNFLIEPEKKKWVEEVYNTKFLESVGYLKDFETTLSILEAGYVSDRKEEAHRIFREIHSINVIPASKVKEALEELNKIKDNLSYTNFKQNFLNKYAVPVNQGTILWKWKKNLVPLETYLNENIPEKLKRYIKGIYVVDVDYDTQKGVYEEKKNDTDNIV